MPFDDNEYKKRRPEGRRLNSVEPFVLLLRTLEVSVQASVRALALMLGLGSLTELSIEF